MSVPVRRWLLWGFLVAALVAVGVAALLQFLNRPEPLPILGQAPELALTNRDGRVVRLADLEGMPWVASFVFTRCPASCPMITARVARLNKALDPDLPVRFVSISVDPEFDTPAVLQRYAESFQAPERWLFLTGSRDDVRRISVEGFKLGLDMNPTPGLVGVDGAVPEPILHSTRLVLVDGHGDIRGYYEAFDEASTARLERDILALANP